MPLNHEEIKESVQIDDGQDSGFGTASYDLHARFVIKSPESDEELTRFDLERFEIGDDGFNLEPQGMVRVISREYIEMPKDVIGYALVKNTLSNSCVLAINIGIIDPSYKGPISSTLINFGHEPFRITKETQFLRLTFHRFRLTDLKRDFVAKDYRTYNRETAAQVRRHSSPKFLVLDKTVQKAGELAFDKFKVQATWAISIIAVVFALISVTSPIVGFMLERWAGEGVETRLERKIGEAYSQDLMIRRQTTYEGEIKLLRERIERLEKGKGAR
jgi:deoxycytidine triphosphate deaminase